MKNGMGSMFRQFFRRGMLVMACGVFVTSAAYGQVLKGSAPALTNQDVVRMVKAGVPESAIIASIQTRPAKFDISPNARVELRNEGVSVNIVDAMVSAEKNQPNASGPTGTMTPGTSGGGSPSSSNSRLGTSSPKLTPKQISAISAKVHSAAGKATSPVITNPGAAQANMSTIGILQQQKQTANTERNQGSSPTIPSSTNPTRTALIARGPIPGPISTAAAPPPSSTPNRTAIMAQPNVNVACATFGTPMITAVSGQQGSTAVFTQDPQYNPFTIRGCNFGNAKGQAQLNSVNGRELASLTIDTWTGTLITAEVPSGLAGALDQVNVTLILFPASGPQAQRSGFRFYAMRAETHLSSIPASEVSLAPITDDGGAQVTAQFSAPYTVAGGSVSGGVDRFNVTRFPGGTDVFDFSKLKPGFTIEKFQVTKLSNAICGDLGPTTTTAYTDGNWNWQLAGNKISVSWQEEHCHDAYFGDASNASYGLDVWLIGPVLAPGESPWQDGVK